MSIEQQLRETLRRSLAGESLPALSREGCERARVADDSERSNAWLGRVSGAIRDELGSPVDEGDDAHEVQP